MVAAILHPARGPKELATPDDYWVALMRRTLVRVDEASSLVVRQTMPRGY